MAAAMVTRTNSGLQRCFGRKQNAGLQRIEFEGFCARSVKNPIEAGNRLSTAFSLLIPLQVISAFWVMLIAAGDPDMIANNPAIALDNRGKRPLAVDLHHFDYVDTIRVKFRSSHCPKSLKNGSRQITRNTAASKRTVSRTVNCLSY